MRICRIIVHLISILCFVFAQQAQAQFSINITQADTALCVGQSIPLNTVVQAVSQNSCFYPNFKNIANSNIDGIGSVFVDPNKNVYVSANYSGTLNFGNLIIPNNGGIDFILIKMDSCGSIQWVVRGGGTGSNDQIGAKSGKGIAVDNNGNVYFVANYNSTCTIYGSMGLTSYSATYTSGSVVSNQDAALIKLNASGQVIWGATLNSAANDIMNGVVLDNVGNPICFGLVNSCCPNLISSSAINHTSGNALLNLSNDQTGFVFKFNPSGVLQWQSRINNKTASINSVAVDAANAIYAVGSCSSLVPATNTTLVDGLSATSAITNVGYGNSFLIKYAATGARQWAVHYGNAGSIIGANCIVNDISIDNLGAVWLVGNYTGASSIFTGTNATTFTLPTDTLTKSFIAKYTNLGVPLLVNTYAKNNSGNTILTGVAAKNNRVLFGGYYNGNTNGSNDMCFAISDLSNTISFSNAGGGPYSDVINGVAWFGNNAAMVGSYSSLFTINNQLQSNNGAFFYIDNASATYPVSYAWSSGQTTSSIIASPVISTKYFCTATCNGQSISDSVMINVTTLSPNLIIQDTISVCGNAALIGAQSLANTTYQWNTEQTTSGIIANYSGKYIVTATSGLCSQRDTVIVSLNNSLIKENDTTICVGDSMRLHLINKVDTQLVDAFDITFLNPSMHFTPATSIGVNYILKVKGTWSMWAPQNILDPAYVYGNALPNAPSPISKFTGWIWNGVQPFVDSSLLRPTPDVYSVTHTYYYPFAGNGSAQSIGFAENPCCYGDNSGLLHFELYKLVNKTCLWNTGSTSDSITAMPTQNSVYWLKTFNGISYCTDSIYIDVNPQPTVSITTSGPTTFCLGDSVILSTPSGAGYFYQWFKNNTPLIGATTSSLIVKTPGLYKVFVNNMYSCNNVSSSINVVVNSLPVVAISAPSNQVCTGSFLNITANPSMGLQYVWYKDSLSIANSNSFIYAANTGGQYFVSVTDINGCKNKSNTLSINQIYLPTINANGPTSFCLGQSVLLNTQYNANYTYAWYYNGLPIGSTAAAQSSYSASNTGNYSVLVVGNGCSLMSLPQAVLASTIPTGYVQSITNDTICEGDSVLIECVTNPIYSVKWEYNGTILNYLNIPQVYVKQPGYYNARITNQGCAVWAQSSVYVVVNALPYDSIIYNSGKLTTSNSSSQLLYYQWFRDGVAIVGATSNYCYPNQNGAYSVKITDANGCSVFSNIIYLNSLSVRTTSMDMPRVFPNPFRDQIFIDAKDPITVELMSVEGRVLGSFITNIIHTNELSKGVYFIKIYSHLKELISIQKIIKQ